MKLVSVLVSFARKLWATALVCAGPRRLELTGATATVTPSAVEGLDSCTGKFQATALTCARFSLSRAAQVRFSSTLELTVAVARVIPSEAHEGPPTV